MTIKFIHTRELFARLDDPELAIVDIRPGQAFNGWKLQDEVRGGHLPGAISFPAAWRTHLSSIQVEALLISKGILPQKKVVIYGYREDSCPEMAQFLIDSGRPNTSIYQDGLQAWAEEKGLPMEHLANYQQLVHPGWLYQLVSGQHPEHPPLHKYAIYEVSWQGEKEFQLAHVPGAIHFDLSRIEDPLTWNFQPDQKLFSSLAGLGISANSTCILYSRDKMASARAALVLMYAGVEDIRVLDGGFDSWMRARYLTETGETQPIPVKAFDRTQPKHPEYLVGIQTVKQILAHQAGLLVSVRSWEEYTGKTSGYDFIQPRGHIPGAIWGYSGTDPNHLQDYRNPDNTMRAYPEISHNWEQKDITRNQKIIFYCGTGWRASEAFLYAHLMGWQHITVFDGGWFEWTRDSNNPIQVGDPDHESL